MVIGESGVGKSTIINMLYNQEHTEDCCLTPCKTGSTASSITQQTSLHLNLPKGWCFMDTVGIGDPTIEERKLIASIKGLVDHTANGFHCVVFVMRMERVTDSTRANLFLLQSIFAKEDLATNGVLVLTHWDGDLGGEEQDLNAWVGEDTTIHELVSSFGKVILTNNTLNRRGAYPEARAQCLRQLNEFIVHRHSCIYSVPVDFVDLIGRLMQRFARSLYSKFTGVAHFFIEEPPVPTICGECSVCMEPIQIREARWLPCEHAYHQGCVPAGGACPLCRAHFDYDDLFSFSW